MRDHRDMTSETLTEILSWTDRAIKSLLLEPAVMN